MNIKDYNQISKKSFGGDANYLKKVQAIQQRQKKL